MSYLLVQQHKHFQFGNYLFSLSPSLSYHCNFLAISEPNFLESNSIGKS